MKAINTTLIILGSVFILSGCYKAGCTDPMAVNYDAEVKKEDLSCTYTGNVVFWTTIAVRDSLIDLGHELLRFELEGEIVDSMSTSGFTASSGDCNAGGTKTITMNFPGNVERYYKYRVKGNNFQTIYEGITLVEANDCTSIQLY